MRKGGGKKGGTFCQRCESARQRSAVCVCVCVCAALCDQDQAAPQLEHIPLPPMAQHSHSLHVCDPLCVVCRSAVHEACCAAVGRTGAGRQCAAAALP